MIKCMKCYCNKWLLCSFICAKRHQFVFIFEFSIPIPLVYTCVYRVCGSSATHEFMYAVCTNHTHTDQSDHRHFNAQKDSKWWNTTAHNKQCQQTTTRAHHRPTGKTQRSAGNNKSYKITFQVECIFVFIYFDFSCCFNIYMFVSKNWMGILFL